MPVIPPDVLTDLLDQITNIDIAALSEKDAFLLLEMQRIVLWLRQFNTLLKALAMMIQVLDKSEVCHNNLKKLIDSQAGMRDLIKKQQQLLQQFCHREKIDSMTQVDHQTSPKHQKGSGENNHHQGKEYFHNTMPREPLKHRKIHRSIKGARNVSEKTNDQLDALHLQVSNLLNKTSAYTESDLSDNNDDIKSSSSGESLQHGHHSYNSTHSNPSPTSSCPPPSRANPSKCQDSTRQQEMDQSNLWFVPLNDALCPVNNMKDVLALRQPSLLQRLQERRNYIIQRRSQRINSNTSSEQRSSRADKSTKMSKKRDTVRSASAFPWLSNYLPGEKSQRSKRNNLPPASTSASPCYTNCNYHCCHCNGCKSARCSSCCSQDSPCTNDNIDSIANDLTHIFTHSQMRRQTERMYSNLPEVKEQQAKAKIEQKKRAAHILRQIYTSKVKEQTLRGKTDFPITQNFLVH